MCCDGSYEGCRGGVCAGKPASVNRPLSMGEGKIGFPADGCRGVAASARNMSGLRCAC